VKDGGNGMMRATTGSRSAADAAYVAHPYRLFLHRPRRCTAAPLHPQSVSQRHEGKRLVHKLGTIAVGVVATTPFLFGGRLYRFAWVRPE